MIVVDTSVFIDLFFEYDRKRTKLADALFKTINQPNVGVPHWNHLQTPSLRG